MVREHANVNSGARIALNDKIITISLAWMFVRSHAA